MGDSGYSPLEQGKRKGYTKARIKGVYEEKLDGSCGMLEEGPDHVLRIDSVVRQPQGPLLLLRASGAGKTTETGAQVEEGQKSMADKSTELEAENKEDQGREEPPE